MADPHPPKIKRRAVALGLTAMLAPGLAAGQQADDQAAIAEEVARLIGREYHDAREARRAERIIRQNARRGRYRGLDDAALAQRLTADAQAVLDDGHFGLMAGVMGSNPGGGPSRPHEPPHRPTPQDLAFLQADNFGLDTVQVLPGNVGRIAIRPQFYRPIDEVRAKYAAAMTLLADTSALIVDCSGTIGGDPNTVALFAGYFFDREPFVLNRFRWRNLPVEEFRITRAPGGPLYGEQKPLIVAVSANSFSAAEEFAYDMQVLQRGVVVGERTTGAANHALPIVVANRLTLFAPQARAENPVTGGNWEGVGITPDVTAARDEIPLVAHRTALQRVIATLSGDRRARAEAALARLQAGR